ncbi:MAG TPA: class I SAM-dependent methyltransferase [Gammaproteobacteria bacterium]|jgi:SAM-dependent methyltransferase|nr:class I SAM-dependent methyltransferase [Gammaproteobacteria bacterium]
MSENAFKDHFSGHAVDYSRYRPGAYPAGMFKALAALAPDRERVWDCATGNGQAALGLAELFERVEATDASDKQIAAAVPHPKIHYAVAPAEASGLPDRSMALVTVAQSLHWFDLPRFYAEVRRVAKPQGLLACSCYMRCTVNPGVDEVTEQLYNGILGDAYWPPERKHVERGYADLAFPFTEIELPRFQMEVQWTLEGYVGYLRSWSATQNYIKRNGKDPLELVGDELLKTWGDPGIARTVLWPMTIRTGYIS